MAIGTLNAKIVLDNAGKCHYGSEDPVTGQIVLSFTPSYKLQNESNRELFGPLQLAVTLHGRAKSKIWKKQGNSTHIYRGRAQLFSQTTKIYDDPFRAQPGQPQSFPFEMYFPATAEARNIGDWDGDRRFEYKPGDPLPPSFSNSYHGFAHRYESFVEYRIGVDMVMPQLKIIVSKPEKYGEPIVQYSRPRPLTPFTETLVPWRGSVSVKNEMLLPEADRPTGFKQKAKATWSSTFSSDFYPTYSFQWNCSSPRNIHIGQPIAFHVSIRPSEESTAVVIPDVFLSSFYAEIKAITVVRAEKRIFSSPESSSEETKLTLSGVADDKGAFSKASDWAKIVNTREVYDISSNFRTYNISRNYSMKVRLTFLVAGKTKEFSQYSSITVHPPLDTAGSAAGPSSSAVASSSSQPFGMDSMEAALPQYEHPPVYDEAVEEPTPTLETGEKRNYVNA